MYIQIYSWMIGLTFNVVVSKDYFISVWGFKGSCSLKTIGYKANGGGEIKNISNPAKSTIATLQETTLQKIAGYTVKGFNSGEQGINALAAWKNTDANKAISKLDKAVNKLVGLAPRFASSLGILGLVFTIIGEEAETGIDEIRLSMNNNFKRMTEILNEQIENVRDYIDWKFIEFERRKTISKLATLQSSWTLCINEITEEGIENCQEKAVDKIIAHKFDYLTYHKEISERFNLNIDKKNALEVLLKVFRNYAMLSIMAVESYADTYSKDAFKCPYCYTCPKYMNQKKYLNYMGKQVESITKFISYTNSAIKQIVHVHTYQGQEMTYCEKTLQCGIREKKWEGIWGSKSNTHDTVNCHCLFDPTLDKSNKCELLFVIRTDGATKENGDLASYMKFIADTEEEAFLKAKIHHLGGKNKKYNKEFKEYVEKYWKGELSLDTWEKTMSRTKELLDKVKNFKMPC